MNYCNFGKIQIARGIKELNLLHSTPDKATTYSNNLSNNKRYGIYMQCMARFPKMYLAFPQFQDKLSRMEKYVTVPGYYKYNNKKGEKKTFIEYFSYSSWCSLSDKEKREHQIEDCNVCVSQHRTVSILHKSYPEGMTEVTVPEIKKERGTPQHMTPVLHTRKVIRESTVQMEQALEADGDDVVNFLASGTSYRHYENDRLAKFYESKDAAEERMLKTLEKESSGKKTKKHYGDFNNYYFDKEGFLQEMQGWESGRPVNWTRLGKKYNVTCRGRYVVNAGQVLYNYARENGISVNIFNRSTRVSGRDYKRRVRRAKKRIIIKKTKFSLPTPRRADKIKKDVKQNLESGRLYIGEKITPQTFTKNKLDPDGNLVTEEEIIYGRKFPLKYIRETEMKRLEESGILRQTTDEEYNMMSKSDILERFDRIRELPSSESTETLREELKRYERTRHMKMWHDHSTLLNHSYASFMVSWLYDPANFLTNSEYATKFPQKKAIDVQTVVERPKLYMFAQSGSRDADQMTYNETRIEDLETLSTPVTSSRGVEFHDKLRIFSGDNPARQFECGQQRGGNYSCLCGVHVADHNNLECCLQQPYLSLDNRCDLLTKGTIWKKFTEGDIDALKKLKKEELQSELCKRGIYAEEMRVPELQENLNSVLHGICRPPALMLRTPNLPASVLNLEAYEVMHCEPLHDISNFVQDVIAELPYHIEDKGVQKEFLDFATTTVGDRNQIKGSDARLFALKLSKFTNQIFHEGKIPKDILTFVDSMVDVISASYSRVERRSSKQILRLYNQSFTMAILAKKIIGQPKKLSSRKFYGSYYHGLTTHLPDAYRIFNLSSTIPEQEERTFGILRNLSERTTNRQAKYVIDNAVLRWSCQENKSTKEDSFTRQNSIISRQAALLPPRESTKFTFELIQSRSTLMQAHCQRIADFLVLGEGIWWRRLDEGIEFFDGPDHPDYRPEGPMLHHFRSTSIKAEQEYVATKWKDCIAAVTNGYLTLPLSKVKVYDVQEKQSIIETNFFKDSDDNTDEPQSNGFTMVKVPSDHLDDGIIQTGGEEPREFINQTTDEGMAETSRLNTTVDCPEQLTATDMQSGSTCKLNVSNDHDEKENNAGRSKTYQKSNPQTRKTDIARKRKVMDEEAACKQACKRRLFIPAKETTSTSDTVHFLLGDVQIVKDYDRYKRLHTSNPHDKSIKKSYDSAFMKVQLAVSKLHHTLKEGGQNEKRKKAEKLMDHWGLYYY